MGRKSFEKAGGLSPERIRQMDADIAQALSSERENGGVDVPSLKLLDAIDAKIRRRNRRSVAGAFAAVCLPLVALCLTAFAELYGWGHEPVMRSVQVPAGESGSDETMRRLRLAVGELPPRQRTIFNLKIYESRSNQEIADMLNVSVNTVKVHYARTMKHLCQRLKKN